MELWIYYNIFTIVVIICLLLRSWKSPVCKSNVCLAGKTALITGSNTGLGYYTALDFAKRGAKVILACRCLKKAYFAQQKIISETGNKNVFIKSLDLGDFESVKSFAINVIKKEDRLDILVNNAGAGGLKDTLTKDGLQLIMQVNHFGHFLLTNLLLDLLRKTEYSRVVNVSSVAAATAFLDVNNPNKYVNSFIAYANSKMANILFTKALAKKLAGTTVTAYSVHPGVVATDFFRNFFTKGMFVGMFRWLIKTPWEGAQTQIHVSLNQNIKDCNGAHFVDCKKVRDYWNVRRLQNKSGIFWDVSEKACKKYL